MHDASSRSHALLRIYVQRNKSPVRDIAENSEDSGSSSSYPEGVLTLVDLAGSEHRIDSMYHSADRRKEGAVINASLMALKECIRAKAAGKNASHQYRKSKLTMALKASFLAPTARTLVIATVSPASKDTEHSLNTLRHACIMDGQQGQGEEPSDSATVASSNCAAVETRFITGGTVVREECGEVNVTDVAKKNMATKKATGKDVDAKTSNGNVVQGAAAAESHNTEMTERQRAKTRRASERRMYAKLTPHCKALLTASRVKLGSDERQQLRLRRGKAEYLLEGEDSAGIDRDVASSTEGLGRYGGSGLQSNGIIVQPKTDKRKSFKKLRDSVYSSADTVPEGILRRQLVTLMKLNRYSDEEILVLLPLVPSGEVEAGKGKSPTSQHFKAVVTGRNDDSEKDLLRSPVQGRRSRVEAGRADLSDSENYQSVKQRPSTAGSKRSSVGVQSATKSALASTCSAQELSAVVSSPQLESGNSASERKKRLAAANAAAAVEQSAASRRSRHEQAKAVRDKIDAEKKEALLMKIGRAASTPRAMRATSAGRTRASEDESENDRGGTLRDSVDYGSDSSHYRASESESPTLLSAHGSDTGRISAEEAANEITATSASALRRQMEGGTAAVKLGEARRDIGGSPMGIVGDSVGLFPRPHTASHKLLSPRIAPKGELIRSESMSNVGQRQGGLASPRPQGLQQTEARREDGVFSARVGLGHGQDQDQVLEEMRRYENKEGEEAQKRLNSTDGQGQGRKEVTRYEQGHDQGQTQALASHGIIANKNSVIESAPSSSGYGFNGSRIFQPHSPQSKEQALGAENDFQQSQYRHDAQGQNQIRHQNGDQHQRRNQDRIQDQNRQYRPQEAQNHDQDRNQDLNKSQDRWNQERNQYWNQTQDQNRDHDRNHDKNGYQQQQQFRQQDLQNPDRNQPDDRSRKQERNQDQAWNLDRNQDQIKNHGRNQDQTRNQNQNHNQDQIQNQGRNQDQIQNQGRNQDQIQNQGRNQDQTRNQNRNQDQIQNQNQNRNQDQIQNQGRNQDQTRNQGRNQDQIQNQNRNQDQTRNQGRNQNEERNPDRSYDQNQNQLHRSQNAQNQNNGHQQHHRDVSTPKIFSQQQIDHEHQMQQSQKSSQTQRQQQQSHYDDRGQYGSSRQQEPQREQRQQSEHRPRMSIQEQHQHDHDQQQLLQKQRQQHQMEQQQQRIQQEQEQQLQLQQRQRQQSTRIADPPPIRHLRSKPSVQQHVGAAAAPWANELTWDVDKKQAS